MPKTLPASWPTTIEAAIVLVKSLAEIDPLDTTKDAILTLQLEQYAGVLSDGGAVVYQPYLNAALFIYETPSRHIIHKAGDGIEFNRSDNSIINESVIRALVNKQLDFNAIYGVEPPINLNDWLSNICDPCATACGCTNLAGVGAFLT